MRQKQSVNDLKFDAIVLAGGYLKTDNKDLCSKPKAFLEINGKPLIRWTLDTLNKCEAVNKIFITSLPKGSKKIESYRCFEDLNGDLIENINLAIKHATTGKVIIICSDTPLITPKMITHFIKECLKTEADGDIFYPIVPKEALKSLPVMKRTFFKISGDLFTGGNVLLMEKRVCDENQSNARNVFKNRKKPLMVARLLGPFFLLKFALGRLTIEDANSKATKILDSKAVTVIMPYPEIGFDVDKETDLELASNLLKGQK